MVLFIICHTHTNNIVSNFITKNRYYFKFSKIIGFILSFINFFIDSNCLSEDSKDFKAATCFSPGSLVVYVYLVKVLPREEWVNLASSITCC